MRRLSREGIEGLLWRPNPHPRPNPITHRHKLARNPPRYYRIRQRCGDNHIAGAIAQADKLGIFGSYGLFAAACYPTSHNSPFILAGYKMFRDYDGAPLGPVVVERVLLDGTLTILGRAGTDLAVTRCTFPVRNAAAPSTVGRCATRGRRAGR
jgi:hypothetical protein